MENFAFKIKANNRISNKTNLAKALKVTEADLDNALSLPESKKYSVKKVDKKGGTQRLVHNPHNLLRNIQHRINNRIFNPRNQLKQSSRTINKSLVHWPDYIFGSVPNSYVFDHKSNLEEISRDYISCAKHHCLSKQMIKIDIENFFDNIAKSHVEELFSKLFKFPRDVSATLAELCTYKGTLVQGALTSSYIASMILWDVEPALVQRLRNKGLVYTRLVDDITISSKSDKANFEFAKNLVSNALTEKDLPINEKKTEHLIKGASDYLVHGLRVNFKEPRLPTKEVSRIRASVNNLEKSVKESNYRTTIDYRKSYYRCLGRVTRMKRVGHNQATLLMKRLDKIFPLPNKNDIKRVSSLIKKLQNKGTAEKHKYYYQKIVNIAFNDINLIQRIYKQDAIILREEVKKLI
ncbi:reverse transcriptase [Thalassotalea insulae]|uniref:Reverse transcriptase n=1 Tax=Thalassotalea insulae TaxID=2056778 RepID=A0ABQ6GQR1_9GAMM|nr:reverse transcriptase family protein [Thalassotalea insulae]GLX77969.1 reverse transcriptase [Thalassotalea insulae]